MSKQVEVLEGLIGVAGAESMRQHNFRPNDEITRTIIEVAYKHFCDRLVGPVAQALYEAQEGTRFSAVELAPGGARHWGNRPKGVQESWRGSARRILKAASTTPAEGAELVAVEDGLPGCPGTRQGAGGAYRCGRGPAGDLQRFAQAILGEARRIDHRAGRLSKLLEEARK